MRFFFILLTPFLLMTATPAATGEPAAPDFSSVYAIFQEHCLDCHEATEPDGNLVLESFDSLMRGGEAGAAIVPGKSEESLLVKMIDGKLEKGGKTRIMPPGKREKLTAAEVGTIRAWINSGALPPAQPIVKELKVPTIAPKVRPHRGIHALAYSPTAKLIAAGRYGEVELISPEGGKTIRTFSGHRSRVNDLAFLPDGSKLFSVSGENGLMGEMKQWDVTNGSAIRTYEGHTDTIYSVAVSPDGKLAATGSYDQKIKLWDTGTGKEIKTLSGHNGAVFGLAFRADGKILASASADRTIKLWNVAKGERVDTLSQPTKDMFTVVFSPDGKKLYSGGADNRIRVWKISEEAIETTNPIMESRFAHEGAILRLAFSPDGKFLLSSAEDRTVKLWDAASLRERHLLERQPDWAPGLCFTDNAMALGRLDGTVGVYDLDGRRLSATFGAQPAAPAQRAVTQK